MHKIVSPLITLGLLAGCVATSQAASVNFANFQQQGSGADFSLAGGPAGVLSTNGGPQLVTFVFSSLAPSQLLGQDINANLVLTSTGTTTAGLAGPNGAFQNFKPVTFTFTAAQNYNFGGVLVAAGSNLLTGVSGVVTGPLGAGGTLQGTIGGNSATFGGADTNNPPGTFNNTVTFTSNYIAFTPGQNAYAYSFSAVNPAFGFTNGGLGGSFINSFTASGTGTFSTAAVPEPGSMALLMGVGVTGAGFLARRKRAKKVA